jgi:hypothetical protein
MRSPYATLAHWALRPRTPLDLHLRSSVLAGARESPAYRTRQPREEKVSGTFVLTSVVGDGSLRLEDQRCGRDCFGQRWQGSGVDGETSTCRSGGDGVSRPQSRQ